MIRKTRGLLALLLAFLLLFTGCGAVEEVLEDAALEALDSALEDVAAETAVADSVPDWAQSPAWEQTQAPEQTVAEDGTYSTREEVALYLHLYGHLPENFITKQEAKALGWVSSEGNLWDVAPGMSIGGDRFGNYEELLPQKQGRTYYECDIDFDGGYRGGKRIVFSNDGLIYYTEDHYESFELLYGRE